MTTTALFNAADLNALPEISGVTDEEATVVERVVWGWLQPILNITDRPDPVTPKVFAWALELGAIYRTNPDGLVKRTSGPFDEEFDPGRRDEILREVAAGGATAGASLRPRSSFPDAMPYPDPAQRVWYF